jgi:hypothetical protein
MQHYGIPTRLLDFTKDELIALYFSVSKFNNNCKNIDEEINDFYINDSFTNCGSSVFCIDPILTNEKSIILENKVIDLQKYNFESLGHIDTPVCIETKNPDKRILAQKGVFVFFGFWVNPYDYYDILNKYTYKIYIPNTCRNQMLFDLKNRYSISHSTVFPDIEGIVMEIKDEMQEKYEKDCAKWKE